MARRLRSPRAASDYTRGNRLKLIRGGKEYFDTLIGILGRAEHFVHLQTYIYEEDETGNRVTEALKATAKRGVDVYMLLDGYASQHLSKEFIRDLKEAGIHFRWFSPLLRSKYFYFGRRMHHKVVVVDGCWSLVGGINIGNNYNDLPDDPAWMDWAVCSEGPVSQQLLSVCTDMWKRSNLGKRKKEKQVQVKEPEKLPGSSSVRVRRNDWVRGKNQISRSYMEMLRMAEKEVTIMSGYFLPGRQIKRLMANAVKRGVMVKVILAGKSDVMLSKHAERFVYRWLVRNGIELYEYQPKVLHGKMSVSDRKWVTLGSYNVNNISAYAAIELNLDIADPGFANEVQDRFDKIMREDCEKFDEREYGWIQVFYKRAWQWICYTIVRILFNLFTFYFRKRSRG